MANIRDSVIDQYGNAVPNALVQLFTDVGAQIGSQLTDINGYFDFANVATGVYRLQISGANLTTRTITPITVVNPYGNATQSVAGLMSAADKTKLDGLPTTVTLAGLGDVALTGLASGDLLAYNGTKWANLKPASSPFVLLTQLTKTGGTASQANLVPQLSSDGMLSPTLFNATPLGGTIDKANRLVLTDPQGFIDFSLIRTTTVGGPGYNGLIPILDSNGRLALAMIPKANYGAAGNANLLAQLNASGVLDPSMLPTSTGTFKGSLDLTVAYVDPGWNTGDYGASSAAGPVHSTWAPYLNQPVPTTVKVGDNIYFTGGKYSVVPSTTDLSAYLPRDGSKPMTGPLPLTDQSSTAPTGDQAVSRTGADRLYQPRYVGTIPSVTQITNKNTAVTLNALQGRIVTSNSSLPTAAMAGPRPAKFQLGNSFIKVGSQIVIHVVSGGAQGAYRVWAGDITADGSCWVYLENLTGAALTQAVTLQFTILAGGTP